MPSAKPLLLILSILMLLYHVFLQKSLSFDIPTIEELQKTIDDFRNYPYYANIYILLVLLILGILVFYIASVVVFFNVITLVFSIFGIAYCLLASKKTLISIHYNKNIQASKFELYFANIFNISELIYVCIILALLFIS